MPKINTVLLSLAMFITTLLYIGPSVAIAQTPKQSIQEGVCDVAGQKNCDSASATTSINNTITAVINILSVVVGIVAVIMIIVAGFRYITSAGNEQTVAGAKRSLIYALIGLIIVALAQVIVRFVLKNVT
jgi:hypothetical protein